MTKRIISPPQVTGEEEEEPSPPERPISLVNPASGSLGVDCCSLYENSKIPSLLVGRLDKKDERAVSLHFRPMTDIINGS